MIRDMPHPHAPPALPSAAPAPAPLPFAQTAAGRNDPGAPLLRLGDTTPLLTRDAGGATSVRTVAARAVSVEFNRDIRPLLARSCVACNNATRAKAGLRLDDDSVFRGVANTWNRLADDREARWGIGYRKFNRPFDSVCWAGGGRARAVYGAVREACGGFGGPARKVVAKRFRLPFRARPRQRAGHSPAGSSHRARSRVSGRGHPA